MAAAAQAQTTMSDNPVWKAVKPFVNGGLSGMGATCIIQPIDMVKVRLQLGATGGPVSFVLWWRGREGRSPGGRKGSSLGSLCVKKCPAVAS